MMNRRKIELLIAWIVIFAVIISFFVIRARSSHSFTYQGKNAEYKFDVQQIGVVTFYRPHVVFNGKEYVYAFRNKPQDLKDISLEEGLENKLNRPKGLQDLYVTKDVNLTTLTSGSVSVIVAPMITILGKTDAGLYQIRVTSAYTSFHAGEPIAPVVDCSTVNLNAKVNKTIGVVLVKLGNENKVYSDGDCIVVEGKDTDGLVKSAEKFAYNLIGVF